MEGASGSYQKEVNFPRRFLGVDDGPPLCCGLDDGDDPLLDLADDGQPQETDGRLLLDLDSFSVSDPTLTSGRGLLRPLAFPVAVGDKTPQQHSWITSHYGYSPAVKQSSAVGSEYDRSDANYRTGQNQLFSRTLHVDGVTQSQTSTNHVDPSSSCTPQKISSSCFGPDIFGAGDPTILGTELPFVSATQSQVVTSKACSSVSGVTGANSSLLDQDNSVYQSDDGPPHFPSIQRLSGLHAARPQVGTAGTMSQSLTRDVFSNSHSVVIESLPVVRVRQPGHGSIELPATAAAAVPTAISDSTDMPSAVTSINTYRSTSHSQGWQSVQVTDQHSKLFSDKLPYKIPTSSLSHSCTNVPADEQPLIMESSDSMTTLNHNVMLDSFPPPSERERVEDGIQRRYGPVLSDEVHCHSGRSRCAMTDRLARRQLLAVLVLCVLFMIGETIGGVLANSLALFTDILHLGSDLISYVISLLALCLSGKQATRRMTFGYHRAEVLGALFSVFIIWLVSGVLCYIAIERIVHKHYMDVMPDEMLITASLGVVFNLIMGFVLHSEKCCRLAKGHATFGHGHSHSHNGHSHHSHSFEYEPLDVAASDQRTLNEDTENDDAAAEIPHHKNLNVRAAFIHVVGDIIQSIGVLIAALIIKFKEEEEYRLADPICTFIFSLLVFCTTVNVLKDTLKIIMEGSPSGVDFEQIKSLLSSQPSVVQVHNLNVWALTMDRNALSVHLAVDDSLPSNVVLQAAIKALKQHKFYHVTIQIEHYDHEIMTSCKDCQLPSK